MEEVAPGIWHWASQHPRWQIVVHSYYLPEERVVIDPLSSPEILDRLQALGPPTDVLLTNRHHYRSSSELAERFGARLPFGAQTPLTLHCPDKAVFALVEHLGGLGADDIAVSAPAYVFRRSNRLLERLLARI